MGNGSARRWLSGAPAGGSESEAPRMSETEYVTKASATLDMLDHGFGALEDVLDGDDALAEALDGYDAELSDGVLTADMGVAHGVWVINQQKPTQQIWMSSPLSGPKKFSFEAEHRWVDRHGVDLLDLLLEEMSHVAGTPLDDILQWETTTTTSTRS